jgi:hypothetical protein
MGVPAFAGMTGAGMMWGCVGLTGNNLGRKAKCALIYYNGLISCTKLYVWKKLAYNVLVNWYYHLIFAALFCKANK